MNGLEGGELAARITPQMRIDMIQHGYNPLMSADVKRYMNKQKPAVGLSAAAGVNEARYQNLGMGGTYNPATGRFISGSEAKDYQAIRGTTEEFVDDFDDYKPIDPRQAVREQMDNSGYGTSFNEETQDINEKLMNRLNSRQLQRQLPVSFDEEREQLPARQTKQKSLPLPGAKNKQLLTETTKVKKKGFHTGVNYVNAFITLIKAPTMENRQKFVEQLNQMLSAEAEIHPQLIKEYYVGVAHAEKALYDKIKRK